MRCASCHLPPCGQLRAELERLPWALGDRRRGQREEQGRTLRSCVSTALPLCCSRELEQGGSLPSRKSLTGSVSITMSGLTMTNNQ